jgi:hypothetical protein
MRWKLLSEQRPPASPQLAVLAHAKTKAFRLVLQAPALPLREAAASPPHFPQTAATRYFLRA